MYTGLACICRDEITYVYLYSDVEVVLLLTAVL